MLVFFLLIFLDSNVMPQIETAVTYGATPWTAVGLFHNTHREAYNDTDAMITYAILCCTAVLEVYSTFPIFSTERDTSMSDSPFAISREQWPEMAAQCSLIRYFARNKNHGKVDVGCNLQASLDTETWWTDIGAWSRTWNYRVECKQKQSDPCVFSEIVDL